MKSLMNWFAARRAVRSVVDDVQSPVAMVEPLEDRCLLAAAPHVTSVVADNRGQVVMKLDQRLLASSVNKNTVKVTRATAGHDRAVNAVVKYDARKRTITVTARIPANGVYKVRLVSKSITGLSGVKLDGEFKGANKRSGNNRPGGDFFMMTTATPTNVARFNTTYGIIDVRLFSETEKTTENFVKYANAADWDGTVFHRSVSNFVIQGGGFKIDSSNQFTPVHTNPPFVINEPHKPGNPGNDIGTIAMARQDDRDPNTHDDENSATDQWYFNVKNNKADLDDNNGGFTAFGIITNAAGLAVMQKINTQPVVNAGGAFAQLPVRSTTPIFATDPPNLNPTRDAVMVTRLAMLTKVVKGVKR